MFREYYSLIKPGIIYGNALTAAAGFFLASHGHINLTLLLMMLLGLSLVIASECVFNNYIDRDIDAVMERTKNRVLVRGSVSGRTAIIYATCLGTAGFGVLFFFTNLLTVAVALFGCFAYIFLYSLWSKRYSMHATLVGTLAGAVPSVVGYVAVSNTLDMGAFILFLILCTWQMPHALAIALYRIDDYAAASIPIFPIKRGVLSTKILMTVYVVLFAVASLMLTLFNYTGYIYATVVGTFAIVWFALNLQGFWAVDSKKWGRRMFLFSLVMILTLCVMIALDTARV